MIAHVAGVPVEELLLPVLASGAGTVCYLLVRTWLASRVPFSRKAKRQMPGPGMSGPGRAEPCSQAERRLTGNASV